MCVFIQIVFPFLDAQELRNEIKDVFHCFPDKESLEAEDHRYTGLNETEEVIGNFAFGN